MSVTLSEVKRAARAHRAPLAGESAGYLVLAIADQVLQAPRLVQASDIQLTEDGALRVMSGHASSDVDAELSLRRALDELLLVASSGSAALTRASRRTAPVGLSSLVRELEAALIPVNRSAARRALARVHRETARALESGSLPDEEPQAVAPIAAPVVAAPAAPVVAAPVVAAPVVAAPAAPIVADAVAVPVVAAPVVVDAVATPVVALAPLAAPAIIEPREPNPELALEPDLDQDLETPALVPVAPVVVDSHLDGVVSALCEQLPLPPQFVESEPLTTALAVRAVPVLAPVDEPEALLEIDVEYETDAVDSSAAPTVMRAVQVAPVALSAVHDESNEPPLLDLPLEARTRPEPVVLRKTLRPLLDFLPKPNSDSEPLPQTPTLGTLASELPILAPEQIAEMTVAANARAELWQGSREADDHTERMPEVVPLSPLSPGVAIIESKKSDVHELLNSFQVAEPELNPGLGRAIKVMADLDLTPGPFAALIR